MNHEQRQQIKRILNVILRRKKIIIFCVITTMVVGIGVYLRSPKIYRASSLIIYQQKVNPTQMSPDMSRFGEVVGAVSQQILSRTSLEGLINHFDLYKGLRSQIPMEDVVDIMRKKHITIEPSKEGNVFVVSYQGGEPRKVLLVTNAIAAKFIEENIRLREETVSETSAYIKDELKMAEEVMNKKDAAMRDYKLNHYNEMPDRLESNISRLNALQVQYQAYQDSLQDLERTKILLQEQIGLRNNFLKGLTDDASLASESSSLQGASKVRQLANLKTELNLLLTRYTEKHPDVKNLQSLIAQLEEELQNPDNIAITTSDSGVIGFESKDEMLIKLRQQVGDVEYNIKKLNKERAETFGQIEKYQKWIENTPTREAEWSDLTRDYEQFSKHYEALVSKNLQAGAAESLERRQKGSQFKIMDPAQLPEKPFKPDFVKIMLMALAVSLGAGGGIAFFLEFLDTSFRDAHDLEKFLALPVTCSIPVIQTPSDTKKARIKSAVWVSMLILSVGLISGGMAYLWLKGAIII